jgi:4'-phosphopantetheinyl transferase
MAIKVLYKIFHNDEDISNTMLAQLPQALVDGALNYRKHEDKPARLYGKLLLKEGLEKMNFNSCDLNDLNYTVYNRPYLRQQIDFNISHSRNVVVCALNTNGNIGIDIERIQSVSINDFQHVWTQKERINISKAADVYKQFYTYWTRKESIIKADGRGMNLPLQDIDVTDLTVNVKQKRWHLCHIPLHPEYIVHIATADGQFSSIELEKFK